MEKKKVLIAEDDTNLGNIIKTYLTSKNFEVYLCSDGVQAMETFKTMTFDICIFDIMMPEKDGFALAQEIRVKNINTPILFITARSQSEDIIEGFEIGCDDYIIKPFLLEELHARIKAVLRRSTGNEKIIDNSNYTIRLSNYLFDYNRQILNFKDEETKLTSKEADLLKLLCDYKNNVLPRTEALTKIWDDDSYFNARSMDVYIAKLRKYLNNDPAVKLLNIHGKGFKLTFP